MNGGPGTNWEGGPGAEQFPHLGNYTLTPESAQDEVKEAAAVRL